MRPKPPFGFETFLDYYVEITTLPEWQSAVHAELTDMRNELTSLRKQNKKQSLALQDCAAKAKFEQDHPTGLYMTCLSMIEKTANEAL